MHFLLMCNVSCVCLCLSMQGKPSLAAFGTAENSPPVLGICHFDQRSAGAAMKGPANERRLYMLRMLPVQPFAIRRAKLRPLIRLFRHPYQTAALHAAKGTESRFLRRRRFMIIDAMTMGIAPAIRAAILLRHPIGRKFCAAYWTQRLPLHRQSLPSPAAIYRRTPFQPEKARKKDSIFLCCLTHTSYITGHTYPRICSVSFDSYKQSTCIDLR